MKTEKNNITLNEEDIKEIFGLFSSPTEYEKNQIYQQNNEHYYKDTDIEDEYELTQSKKEFSLDAWRSVLQFLCSKGYNLTKNDEIIDISFVEDEFL